MGSKVNTIHLKKLMRARKISVPELVERTGIPRNSIYCYLGGRIKTPTITKLRLLARALDCSVEYLLDE